MIRRREFLTLLGGAAVVWPLAGGQQAAMRVRHLLNSYQKNITTRLAISDAPISRAVQTVGRTLAMPVLGGLHHQSSRYHVPSTGGD